MTLDRSTLCNWVGRACWWLAPLHELVLSTVLSSPKLFADDTTLPVLDPGRGRTKTGRLWCYAVDNRPWCGPAIRRRPMCTARTARARIRRSIWKVQRRAPGRWLCRVRAAGRRSADGSMRLAFCWATRDGLLRVPCRDQIAACRRSAGAHRANSTRSRPISAATPPNTEQVRQERSRPLVEAMHVWLTNNSTAFRVFRSGQGHPLRVESLARIGRVPRRWPPGAGHEHRRTGHQAVTLTRKNALFAGTDGGARHWAIA